MDNKQDIIRLYEKYGFTFHENSSNSDFLAFTYKTGFFHNAEIISLDCQNKEKVSNEMEEQLNGLKKLGYSSKKSFYNSIEDIEKSLFEGFFNTKDWKNRVLREYKDYTEKIMINLPEDKYSYKYIDSPFSKNRIKKENTTIIREIFEDVKKESPQLIIIEAPAGFGKTSTSYEILKELVKSEDMPIPFFTEFSRDRQARVFNHILMREVDKSFHNLKSDVVIEEIKSGKILIILDGFDELLHDDSAEGDKVSAFEKNEPMLETISELLTNNSKVILTTRKSSIFDGELFADWINKYQDKFVINRYQIEKPEIKHWLDDSRYKQLGKTFENNVYFILNPVLLSFLRFSNDETFNYLINNPLEIVEKYFSIMLEREMSRQNLPMKIEQQNKLLDIVAQDMCDNNYTSDSKEKIINLIKAKAIDLLNDVRDNYPPKDRPTIDKLATTLSNHAFFDRSQQGENNIQFINEFVFGNYISRNIINSDGEWISSDERFVEPAVFSYISREKEKKLLLWEKLNFMKEFLSKSSQMKYESLLTDCISEEIYNDSEIKNLTFKNIDFFRESTISNSIFIDCEFTNINFNMKMFKDITFSSCKLWNCTVSNINENIIFYNCLDDNDLIINIEDSYIDMEFEDYNQSISMYIFEKLWPKGSHKLDKLYYFIGDLLNNCQFTKKEILKEINRLKREGLLLDGKHSNFIMINKSKLKEIKKILGREFDV